MDEGDVAREAPREAQVVRSHHDRGARSVDLAHDARRLRPDLAILLTSGYLGAERPTATAEFPLLDKPYDSRVLAARIRDLLKDRPERPEGTDTVAEPRRAQAS